VKDVSVVVVTHNSEAEIGPCLDALTSAGEVIVVDNASADGSVEEARRRPRTNVIANADNRGFAGAVNQGARAAHGRHLLLMNPDAVLAGGGEALARACERTGIAAGCLVNPDGTPQAGFTVRRLPTPLTLIFECLGFNRLWPGNPVNRRYRCQEMDIGRSAFVEQPAGAFLMIRRDVFDRVGPFDEQFWPVWYEDVDWCNRAAARGYKIEFVPEAKARHVGAHSVGRLERGRQRLYWYGSLLRYTGKHFGSAAVRAVACSIMLGSLPRWFAGMGGRGKEAKGELVNVLQMAAASFKAGGVVCPFAADHDNNGRSAPAAHPADGKKKLGVERN
jgi:N-acetylglucosaminyl-diphospho-decaprenol L-rhamnosyltransferase